MTKTSSLFNKHLPPLADRVRPNTISDFIGQNHLIDSKRIINEMVTKNKYYSMIL